MENLQGSQVNYINGLTNTSDVLEYAGRFDCCISSDINIQNQTLEENSTLKLNDDYIYPSLSDIPRFETVEFTSKFQVKQQPNYEGNSYFLIKVTHYRISETGNNKYMSIRRYKNFAKLHNYISKKYFYLHIPQLPEKTMMCKIFSSVEFLEEREQELELYLNQIASKDELFTSEVFNKFLRDEVFDDNYFENIKAPISFTNDAVPKSVIPRIFNSMSVSVSSLAQNFVMTNSVKILDSEFDKLGTYLLNLAGCVTDLHNQLKKLKGFYSKLNVNSKKMKDSFDRLLTCNEYLKSQKMNNLINIESHNEWAFNEKAAFMQKALVRIKFYVSELNGFRDLISRFKSLDDITGKNKSNFDAIIGSGEKIQEKNKMIKYEEEKRSFEAKILEQYKRFVKCKGGLTNYALKIVKLITDCEAKSMAS